MYVSCDLVGTTDKNFCVYLKAKHVKTGEVVAIKKMSFSGKQSGEVTMQQMVFFSI